MPRLTRARNVCLAAAAATAALGAFVSSSAGNSSAVNSGLARQSTPATSYSAHTTATGFIVKETSAFTLSGNHFVQKNVKCPAGYAPISGVFVSSKDTDFTFQSAPLNGGWVTALSNPGSSSATVRVGVICAS